MKALHTIFLYSICNASRALNILDILLWLGHIWGFVGCYLKIWSLISKLNSLPGFEVSWRKWNFKAERSRPNHESQYYMNRGKDSQSFNMNSHWADTNLQRIVLWFVKQTNWHLKSLWPRPRSLLNLFRKKVVQLKFVI